LNKNFKEDNHHHYTQDELNFLYSDMYAFLENNNQRCVDNYRVAKCSNSAQVRRYRRQQSKGCCGFYDEVVEMWSWRKFRFEKYMVGCNYGH
jgi:hypothetical protein